MDAIVYLVIIIRLLGGSIEIPLGSMTETDCLTKMHAIWGIELNELDAACVPEDVN